METADIIHTQVGYKCIYLLIMYYSYYEYHNALAQFVHIITVVHFYLVKALRT